MQPTGTQISGNRGARSLLPGALARGSVSTLVLLFLLVGSLPCATLFGCCCPCSGLEAVHGSGVSAPKSCCGAATEASQTFSLPTEPQRRVAAPAILSATVPDSPAVPFSPELPRPSRSEAKLYDLPPLILLLCTLLN